MARRSLFEFTRQTYGALYPADVMQESWHMHLICQHLEAVERGEIKRLAIFAPPRHLKTEFVSRRFPAWYLGRNPHARIIAASYSADLANRISTDVQRIVDHDTYKSIFPGTRLNSRNVRSVAGAAKRTVELWEVLDTGGAYRAAGVGGGITGMGADLLILDDPVKDRAEANSLTYRDGRWDWYLSTFLTRLQKGGAVVAVFTRWHEDDIAGRILSGPDAENWTVLRLPALADDDPHPNDPRQPGEALWPYFMDAQAMQQRKMVLGEYEFGSLYQQRPSPKSGGLFQVDRISTVDVVPAGLKHIRRWDTAATEGAGDYTVGLRMAGPDADGLYYVVDVVRCQHEPGKRDAIIRQTVAADGRQVRQVFSQDPGAAGVDQVRALTRLLSGYSVSFERETGSKEVRAEPFAAQVNGHMVRLGPGTWHRELLHELASFPYGRHDDQVDTAAGAFNALSRPTNRQTGGVRSLKPLHRTAPMPVVTRR